MVLNFIMLMGYAMAIEREGEMARRQAVVNQYVGKTYRIQILDGAIPSLLCLPAIGESHTESEIPKNSIVTIVDHHELSGQNWYVVTYNFRKYFVTENQVKDFFIEIHVRHDKTRRV